MSDNWPKHPDGRNMKIGEMTQQQRREVSERALSKVCADMNRPAMRAALSDMLGGTVTEVTSGGERASKLH